LYWALSAFLRTRVLSDGADDPDKPDGIDIVPPSIR